MDEILVRTSIINLAHAASKYDLTFYPPKYLSYSSQWASNISVISGPMLTTAKTLILVKLRLIVKILIFAYYYPLII